MRADLVFHDFIHLVFFGWKEREKRSRPGVVMIFLYNVIPLFFTLLLLSALIFKAALTVLVDSGIFSLSIVILGIVAFFLSSAFFFRCKMLDQFLFV